ncbi:FadR/GntR family transcriptional regulator [Paraburkholderia sp. GAS334]|uniref:FadR/GntR family transcriptional regulator n=1 Tax=Paraburkholderia sp. GAS334 TaxID=3035131 RepID=UPI003D195B4F
MSAEPTTRYKALQARTTPREVRGKTSAGAASPGGPQHLPDEIAAHLAQAIRAKEFTAGDRLPSERLLGEQFSVSRAVVREALSKLKSEGLVTSKAGSGVYVTDGSQRQAFRMQEVELGEKDSLTMVMELLITVEVAATRFAAMRRTADDLKRIRRALIGMEYEIANDRLGDEEDFAFHQAIVDATHNPHFQALSEHLEHGARRLIRQARNNTKSQHAHLIEAVQQEHKQIFEAISASDAEQAGLAAETHLRNSAKRLKIYLKG